MPICLVGSRLLLPRPHITITWCGSVVCGLPTYYHVLPLPCQWSLCSPSYQVTTSVLPNYPSIHPPLPPFIPRLLPHSFLVLQTSCSRAAGVGPSLPTATTPPRSEEKDADAEAEAEAEDIQRLHERSRKIHIRGVVDSAYNYLVALSFPVLSRSNTP